MYCNYCGKVIQDDANVCAYCGKTVVGVVARRQLLRSRTNRKIAGVCAGLALYFDMDITLMRVLWIAALLVPPAPALLAYIILWIVVPEEPERVVAPAAVQAVNH